jgi:hypothetical protein
LLLYCGILHYLFAMILNTISHRVKKENSTLPLADAKTWLIQAFISVKREPPTLL